MSTPWPSVCRHRGSVCLLLFDHCRWLLCCRLLFLACLLIGWSVLFRPTSIILNFAQEPNHNDHLQNYHHPHHDQVNRTYWSSILFDRCRHVANTLLAFRATTISMVPGGGRANATERGADNLTGKCFLVKIRRIMIIDTFRDMILKLHVSQIDWLKTRLSCTLRPVNRDPHLIKSGRSLSGQAGLLTTFFCLAPSTTEKCK